MSETASPVAAPPAMLDFSDPMVVAQVEARAFQIAHERSAATMQTVPVAAVEKTSVAAYQPNLDEVTVQFTRFSLVGFTSYMKGQSAGFPSRKANELVASGRATIIHRHEQPVTARRAR